MNRIVIIIILACIIAVSLLLVLNLPKQRLQTSKVCFQENCFIVEIVTTPLQMEKGLMFREYLDKNKGMLFVFEKEGNYPFWMKNTLIPLDMIWINQNQEVVFIKENALPCPISIESSEGQNQDNNCPIIEPGQKSKYVLEINGGISKNINLKLGDKIILENML